MESQLKQENQVSDNIEKELNKSAFNVILNKLLNLESLIDFLENDKSNVSSFIVSRNLFGFYPNIDYVKHNQIELADEFFEFLSTFTFSVFHTDTKIFDIWSSKYQFKTCVDISNFEEIPTDVKKAIMNIHAVGSDNMFMKLIDTFIIDIFDKFMGNKFPNDIVKI